MTTLRVIFEYNVIEITEELADHRDVGITTVWETPDVQPEEVSEGEITDRNEERNCDETDENVPEELRCHQTNFTLETFLEIIHDNVCEKDQMVDVHPNVEGSMII